MNSLDPASKVELVPETSGLRELSPSSGLILTSVETPSPIRSHSNILRIGSPIYHLGKTTDYPVTMERCTLMVDLCSKQGNRAAAEAQRGGNHYRAYSLHLEKLPH